MIQINPLKSYIDGGVRAALTTPPSASLVFDLPGKAIWVKGVKLKGTDHTYTFSHDNYITLTNTPDSNESEDIKIGVNTSALKSAIDTTYEVVSTTTNGLAPKFTSGNKQAAAAATTYYFLGWAGSTLKWYQAPFRNIRINSETTDCLGVNNTDPLIIGSGNGISVTWDSTNKKIIITNTKPDVNHNTDTKVAQSVTTQNKNYAIILKGNDSDEGSITTVNFSTYLKFNPSTKQLTINGNKVITTINTFVGATTSADGSVGLVTKPLIANRLQFLRGDGTWATPVDTWRPVKVEGTEKLGSNALDLSAGNGISIIYNSDTKKIIITNTKPDINHNTHYTTMLYIGENNDIKANKNVANPYLKLFDDNARRATFQIKAGNGIAVASDANGNITITNSSPDVNHNTDITVKQTPKTDNINRPLMMINGDTSTGEQINTSMFSTGIYANASTKMITANGFIKAGSSNSYVLLGGGSHKALSDFSMAHSHPYLPLSGGTMTGTPYINMPASAYSISDDRPFGITYGRIQCYGNLNIAADTDGSTTEYIILTSGRGMGSATRANGLAVGYNSLTWKNNNVLHAGNSSVSKSGETLSVKINDTSYSLTNTWRGIQDNLTSTSTSDSLSANQGRILNSKFDNYLVKTTYDYHKEFSASYTNYIELGCFSLYDSMVGIDITLTTTQSWMGRLIISSQNINSSGGGGYEVNVRGDNSLSLHTLISVVRSGTYFRVYLNASGWKKLFCHIWCVAASASEIFQTVGSMPSSNVTINNPSGTFEGNVYAANFYTTSDARKKQNIHKISDNIKQFEWKETGETSYGFVAQDLEVNHPELVNDNGNIKTVNYNAALSLVIAKLENRVKELEAKLGIESSSYI